MRQYTIIYLQQEKIEQLHGVYAGLIALDQIDKHNLHSQAFIEEISKLQTALETWNRFSKQGKGERLICIGEVDSTSQGKRVAEELEQLPSIVERHSLLHKVPAPQMQIWTFDLSLGLSNVYQKIEDRLLSLELTEEDKLRLIHSDSNSLILGFLIKGIELLPDSFFVSFPEQGDRLQTYSIDHHLEREQIMQLAHAYLETHDYQAVQELFIGAPTPVPVLQLLALYQRLNDLSFKQKGKIDPEYQDYALFDNVFRLLKKHDLQHYKPYCNVMRGLIEERQTAFIPFLYHQMMRYFEEQNYIDYVVRHYRLLEELLMYALGWDVEFGQLVKRKQANPKQRSWAITLRKDQKMYRHLVREFRKMAKQWKVHNELYNYVSDRNVQELIDMRHEGIGGHGFEEITNADIERIFSKRNYNEVIHSILKKMGFLVDVSYYQILDHLLLLELEEFVNAQ